MRAKGESLKICFALLCVLLVFFSCLTRVCLAASETEAAAAIASTRQKVVLCYQSVSEADSAGANVTGLLSVLDEAGLLLSKADLAYGRGEYDSAHAYAVSGLERLGSFEIEARDLRELAFQHGYWDFMLNIVGSLIGAVSVMVAGFAVWAFLRRKYGKSGGTIE